MFNKIPINPVREAKLNGTIHDQVDEVFQQIKDSIPINQTTITLALDGTHGANFDKILTSISNHFSENGFNITSINSTSFLKSSSQLRQIFDKNITDNRAFGYVTDASIEQYFTDNAQQELIAQSDKLKNASNAGQQLIIVYGVGASWLCNNDVDFSIYLDVSREYQQVQYKKDLLNFGFDSNKDSVEKYKIALFVEWPILENYRKQSLSQFQYYVDLNDDNNPKIIQVEDLFLIVNDIAKNPMRVKPFFAPGVWGGQRLKQLAGLPDEMVNCAWSFEPIAPENSILIEYDQQVIEIPFLIVMALSNKEILGDRLVELFGDFFPIRFDYLDTFDGGNLSCQVHPTQKYIRENFNWILEQQESYYIMEKKGDAKVYLGLTDNSTEESFYNAVSQSQETAEPIEFTDYVQEWPSEKGSLYLIPTGTVHCSGIDNLVLEISATTWWFTFKIYDYVRKDLDGNPRPINIDHAFKNIDFTRKKDWVKENLMQEPILIREQGSNSEYQLGKRDDILFYVNRLHLQNEWVDDTNEELLLLNLVEGDKVRVISEKDESVFVEFTYAESYILPASFGKFKIVNLGSQPCKLIKAGVSPEWDVKLLDE